MSASAEEQGGKADTFKWLIVTGLIGATIWGNQYFQDESVMIRVPAILVLAVLALLIAVSTAKGKAAFQLIKDSNIERRKVVWPVRQEALRTTGVVFVFVTLMGLFLWLLDMLLIRLYNFII